MPIIMLFINTPFFHYESFLESVMDYFVSIYVYAPKDICESVKCFIKLNDIFALFSKYMSEI